MNIDELKDAWSQDEPTGMNLPLSTAMLGKTNSAVRKLRKNMKAEFIALVICYVIIIWFVLDGTRSSFFFDMSRILIFSLLVLNTFYYFRFYAFYRSIGRYDLNIRNSLRKIVYELELNEEIYKTYSFSAMPLSILTAVALIASKIKPAHMHDVLTANGGVSLNAMLMIFAIILISYVITYFFINLHVRLTYGKYLAELKQVMNDLGEDA
jgi:uncharacterized membrane protein YwzB